MRDKFMKTGLVFVIVFLLGTSSFSGIVIADDEAGSNVEDVALTNEGNEGLYVDSDNSNAEHLALTNPTWMNSANEEDGSQSVGLSFDFLKPIISKKGGYDTVVIDGLYNHAMPGEPVLPFKTAKILLPEGKNLLSVNVATSDKVMLNGRFNIEPGQKPVPLMDGIDETETNKQISQESSKPLPYNTILKNKQDRTPPNQTIYSSSKPFPEKLYDSIGVQVFGIFSLYCSTGILFLNAFTTCL